MSNGGDAAEQVVRLSLDGVEFIIKIAGAGAKNLASMLMAAVKSKKAQPTNLKVTGQERLKRMIKSGKPLDVFPVREQDIRTFMQEAKKYGVVYCAIRDKEPKADGMIDVLVRKEDSPKIDRVMERLQYAAMDKASIKSEIVKSRAEQGAEPTAPDRADTMDVDGFLDSIMPSEGKSKQEQNQAVQTSVQQSTPEVGQEPFFSTARTRQNPSEHGLDSISNPGGKTTEPPSVREEIASIRSELKAKEQSRIQEPQRGKPAPQQTTRHRQPANTRKPKNKSAKER